MLYTKASRKFLLQHGAPNSHLGPINACKFICTTKADRQTNERQDCKLHQMKYKCRRVEVGESEERTFLGACACTGCPLTSFYQLSRKALSLWPFNRQVCSSSLFFPTSFSSYSTQLCRQFTAVCIRAAISWLTYYSTRCATCFNLSFYRCR